MNQVGPRLAVCMDLALDVAGQRALVLTAALNAITYRLGEPRPKRPSRDQQATAKTDDQGEPLALRSKSAFMPGRHFGPCPLAIPFEAFSHSAA